jgi:hypothetical protein
MNVTMCLRRKWQAIGALCLAAEAFANVLIVAPLVLPLLLLLLRFLHQLGCCDAFEMSTDCATLLRITVCLQA